MLRRFGIAVPGMMALLMLAVCSPAGADPQVVSDYPQAGEIAPGTVHLVPIAPDIWTHVSTKRFLTGTVFASNGLVIRHGEELFLVDSAWGAEATARLLAEIRNEIGIPVRKAVVTHFHDDRLSGVEVLEHNGIEVFATALTRELAAQEGNPVPSLLLPEIVEPGDRVWLGPVEVMFPGPAHSRDNLVVYLPDSMVLFGGCAVFELARETAGNIADADLDAWPQSIQRISDAYPGARVLIPGHGVPGGPELLEHTLNIIRQKTSP